MPKVVDHELRRRELAASGVACHRSRRARSGDDPCRRRRVGLVDRGPEALLRRQGSPPARSASRARTYEPRAFRASPPRASDGRAAIAAALAGILRGGADESRVWIAFMFRASVDRATAAAMRRAIKVWVARWAELVVSGQQDGSIRPDLDPDQVAAELHALINGLRIQASFRSRRSFAVRSELQLVFMQSLDPEDATTRPLEVAP